MTRQLELPNDWNPRKHQRNLWDNWVQRGGDRVVAVWHRRAGKDSVAVNGTSVKMQKRIGNYWHMLPEAAQARKAIWDAIDKVGRRVIDQAFPVELRASTNNTEMKITFTTGSTWQVVGSDNYNSLVGANPVGIVFSEYSIAKPLAWDYFRPILRENGGWALFIYTARGHNHGRDMYEMASRNPKWFCERLTVDDTGVITEEEIQEERNSGMSPDMVLQEYYCSFDAAMVGSYYGDLMRRLEDQGRFVNDLYDPNLKVDTAWDLGFTDDTAIFFVQLIRGEVRIIDYYECSGEGMEHYAEVLEEKGYQYDRHWVPHDASQKLMAAGGKSIIAQGRALGIERMVQVRSVSVQAGIQAARAVLPNTWWDIDRTADGAKAMRSYCRKKDLDRNVFSKAPEHNWASHAADAFRYLAVAYQERAQAVKKPSHDSNKQPTLDERLKSHDKVIGLSGDRW